MSRVWVLVLAAVATAVLCGPVLATSLPGHGTRQGMGLRGHARGSYFGTFIQERSISRARSREVPTLGGSGAYTQTWKASKGTNTLLRIESLNPSAAKSAYLELRNKNSDDSWGLGEVEGNTFKIGYGKGNFKSKKLFFSIDAGGAVTFDKHVVCEKKVDGFDAKKSSELLLLEEDERVARLEVPSVEGTYPARMIWPGSLGTYMSALQETSRTDNRGRNLDEENKAKKAAEVTVKFYSMKGSAAFRIETRDKDYEHNVFLEFLPLHKTKTWSIGMKKNQELIFAYGPKGNAKKHKASISMETDGKVTLHDDAVVESVSSLLEEELLELGSTVSDLDDEVAWKPDHQKGTAGDADPAEIVYSTDGDVTVVLQSGGGASWVEFRNKKSEKSWGVGVNESNDLHISYGTNGIFAKEVKGLVITKDRVIKFYKKPTFRDGVEISSTKSTSAASRHAQKAADSKEESEAKDKEDQDARDKKAAAIKECAGNPIVQSMPDPGDGATTLKPNFSKSNMCLDVAKGGRKKKGANVIVWECMTKEGAHGQGWKIKKDTKQIVASVGGGCLSVDQGNGKGDNSRDGLNVIVTTCHAPKEPEEKQGDGGVPKTVDGKEDKKAAEGETTCKECEKKEEIKADEQQWEMQGNGKFIKHVASGKCLNVAGAERNLRNGLNVHLWPCQATKAGEQWSCGHQCHHGGTQDPANCLCECAAPWEGFSCNQCSAKCLNGGTMIEACCMCECPELWAGKSCETCLRKCYNDGMLDAGNCKCTCKGYWAGSECKECQIPCQNGGVPDPDTCTCDCAPAKYWTGEFCEVKLFIDEAEDSMYTETTTANLIHEIDDKRKDCLPEPLFQEPIYTKLDVKVHRNNQLGTDEYKIELQFELSIVEAHIKEYANGTLEIIKVIPPLCDIAMVSGAFIEMLDNFADSDEVQKAYNTGMMAINQERSGKCGKNPFDETKLLSAESKSIQGVIYKMGVNVGRKLDVVVWVLQTPSDGQFQFLGSTPPPCHIGEILETTYNKGTAELLQLGESPAVDDNAPSDAEVAAKDGSTDSNSIKAGEPGAPGDDYMPGIDENVEVVPPQFDARLKWPLCFNQSESWSVMEESVCGASWAIASTSVFAHRLCALSKQRTDKMFSTWQHVTCNNKYPVGGSRMEMGCEGGLPVFSWKYMVEYGIAEENCMEYPDAEEHIKAVVKVVQEGCSQAPKCDETKLKQCKMHKIDPETVMRPRKDDIEIMERQILRAGAIQAEIVAHQDFARYGTGMYQRIASKDNFPVGARAVALVGWGVDEESGEKYWLAENSFGVGWGEEGYVRIAKGVNMIGIETSITWGDPAKENCELFKGGGCKNSGVLEPYSCTCDCVGGFTGTTCETCDLTCENGGYARTDTCVCECKGTWHGASCELGEGQCGCSICGPQYHCGGEDSCPRNYDWCKIHPDNLSIPFDGTRPALEPAVGLLQESAREGAGGVVTSYRSADCPGIYEHCERQW